MKKNKTVSWWLDQLDPKWKKDAIKSTKKSGRFSVMKKNTDSLSEAILCCCIWSGTKFGWEKWKNLYHLATQLEDMEKEIQKF